MLPMDEPKKVTAILKVTAEFYDPEATPETVRACVEQDLEDAGYEVDVSNLESQIERDFKDFVTLVTGERYESAATYAMAKAHWLGSENYKGGKWIPVKDRMPPERDSIFAKVYGTKQWNPNMFQRSSDDVRVAVRFEDGTRMVTHDKTIDGKWHSEKDKTAYPKQTVTHWMKNPELPEDEA